MTQDNSKKFVIAENGHLKILRSENYNYVMRKEDGYFMRWGKKEKDDPAFSPFGPEILDIEVTEVCHGVPGVNGVKAPCAFCYKSNGPKGRSMNLDTFKIVLDKFPKTLTQIAFGADAEATANPDLWGMMEYTRSKGITPNITVANITDDTADKLASLCGAVAVSRYANKNVCYDSVKKLTDRGMKQVNIHAMVSEETFDACMETLHDRLTDPRLAKMNAIVLLSLKKKGRGTSFHSLSQDKFTQLVKFAMDNKIGVGFDSCSAHKFLAAIADHPNRAKLETFVEPCESFGMFSSYVNVEGKYFPCSFCENIDGWNGIDLASPTADFMKDVWDNERLTQYRQLMIQTNRNCPVYEI